MSSSTVQTPSLPGAIVPCSANKEFILALSCADRVGIVYKITSLLANEGYNILDSQQFGDSSTSRFFMRVHFAPHSETEDKTPRAENVNEIKKKFDQIKQEYDMQLEVFDAGIKPRVMVMVSKIGHTLNDLLFRAASGAIPIDIPLIVSNHPDFEPMAKSYNIPFKYLPFDGKDPAAKKAQETEVLKLFAAYECEYIVLARYMQIISSDMCATLPGKILNIHHSALPSFLGANPYRQAYNRGVKLIGATSHFVTADLDEGPIIAQDVVPVDHTLNPKALTQLGSTVENVVLGRAVKAVAERRVLLNGHKTVIFS